MHQALDLPPYLCLQGERRCMFDCMCFAQCFNKVTGKPSPTTAGSRATLHRFFKMPEKAIKEAKRPTSYNDFGYH